MECIFCDIAGGEKSGYIVYNDNQTMAILDIFPAVEGHLMVIPKKHGETVLDYSKDELGVTMEVVKKIIKALTKTYYTKVFTVGINHAEKLGVPHLHVHIIPRYEDDNGGIIQKIVTKPSKNSLKDVTNKIKSNI
ncbi:HIT family protein [Candidatus Gottesmanbacteria bacterium]|nr:HIT family protein [Candidatus Gottesmanbacteria bacterium]